jgi:hypothetical protein
MEDLRCLAKSLPIKNLRQISQKTPYLKGDVIPDEGRPVRREQDVIEPGSRRRHPQQVVADGDPPVVLLDPLQSGRLAEDDPVLGGQLGADGEAVVEAKFQSHLRPDTGDPGSGLPIPGPDGDPAALQPFEELGGVVLRQASRFRLGGLVEMQARGAESHAVPEDRLVGFGADKIGRDLMAVDGEDGG